MSPIPTRFLFRAGVTVGLSLGAALAAADNSATEYSYLSGHGPKDAVPWEFSVTGGRRSGEQTTIPVPSNWELQGFGGYNYGQEPVPKANEHGLYRLHFTAPAAWKGRRVRLVFEGVMTDAFVKVNGHPAGPVHQGGFYRFRYDVTPLVKLGADNLLEVDVAKVSANAGVEGAERSGDYWVFGGIYRPVYLEAVPAESIEQASIDARADGTLNVDVTLGSVREADRVDGQVLAADGQAVGAPFSAAVPNGGTGSVHLATRVDSPRRWTAETPNLYALQLTLRQGPTAVHTITERFGFRTFEVRAGQGLFLNGQRILLKGVGRHSFRPETGRALTREDCYDDARLIKEMNMNAVRMTHYPPDAAFLEACDELGLYVLDELSGWHHAQETEVGRRLVREMVTRDVNHPSILFWDNGNEGGFNRELDGEFALYDPQHRTVLHPWELFDGIDTKHYPTYDDLASRLSGPNLVMPTEMIHGLYDGGAGSGLEDYWNLISRSPHGAGGFIWVFADDGIVRTDQGGRVDVFSTYAPDGILGPHHEKEGSFYTIRDLYSPVQIDPPVLDENFDGGLAVHNRYYFTSLSQCRFVWRLLRYPGPAEKGTAPAILSQGSAPPPPVAPQQSGRLALDLPANWREAEALSVAVLGPDGRELWNSVWPTPALARHLAAPAADDARAAAPAVEQTSPTEVRLRAGGLVASFDRASGMLREVRRDQEVFPFANGPRLVFAHPAQPDDVAWLALDAGASAWTDSSAHPVLTGRLAAPHLANTIEATLDYPATVSWQGFRLEISPDGLKWKTLYEGTRRTIDGKLYEFPPQPVAAVRLSNFRRSDGQAVTIKTLRVGYEESRFPGGASNPATVTSGTDRDARTGADTAWIESRGAAGLTELRWTLSADGALRLDYRYALDGTYSYHGITFDFPEDSLAGMRWLGQGPYRVWQNRLRGTWLGIHEILNHDVQPGENWDYPEFQGCFAGVRWVRLETAGGPVTISSADPDAYFRVGTPRISHINTTVAFPAGDISFLHAIPPMGSKFIVPEKTGPASQWAKASGEYAGSLTFRFGP
jgi:hypothetical protein